MRSMLARQPVVQRCNDGKRQAALSPISAERNEGKHVTACSRPRGVELWSGVAARQQRGPGWMVRGALGVEDSGLGGHEAGHNREGRPVGGPRGAVHRPLLQGHLRAAPPPPPPPHPQGRHPWGLFTYPLTTARPHLLNTTGGGGMQAANARNENGRVAVCVSQSGAMQAPSSGGAH